MKRINKNIFTILILAILLFLTIYSCKYDQIPFDPGSGFINGDVVDAVTGPTFTGYFPLGGAEITTEPASSKTTTSDDGTFLLDNVQPGKYLICADKEGYHTNWGCVDVVSMELSTVRIVLDHVIEGNNTPSIPTNPVPGDGKKIAGATYLLQWECIDPDDEMVFFSVYFGKLNPPVEQAARRIYKRSFEIDSLERKATYYWRISAVDVNGASVMGPTWSFTTF